MKTRKKSKFSCCLYPFVFLLLLLLIAFSGCEKKSSKEAKPATINREPTQAGEINLQETRLASIPDDYDKGEILNFSMDGRKVFYKAIKGGKQSVVINDKAGKFYEAINDMILFSRDRKRVAYDGKRGGKEYLVVDNKEVAPYDDVAADSFSPDGRLVSCQVEDKREKKWFIVVSDGEKEVYRSQAYPDTYRMSVFSPDGRLVAYELGENKKKIGNKKRTIFFLDVSTWKIISEQHCGDCDLVGSFSFNSDSSRVIYNVKKGDKNLLVLLDFALKKERMVELPYASIENVALNPDGKKIALTAVRAGKQFLVKSSWESPEKVKEKGPYEEIVSPVFGPGSTPFALAFKKGTWRSVIGDREGAGEYDNMVAAPVFSPDGARVAYPGMKSSGSEPQNKRNMIGKWFMVVDQAGKSDTATAGPHYDMVVSPVFGPDGKYIAYRVRTGTMENPKRFIVIADADTGKVIKEGQVGDEIWPLVWSADGKTAAYGARIGRELWWKVEKLGE